MVDKHYGANKDQYFDTAKKAIKEYVDPELQPILGNYEEIPNDLLVAVSSAMNNMYKAIKEEDGAPSNRQSTTAENSKEYWQNLILERNKLDPFNPKYDELQAKITEYFARTSR